LKAVQGGAPEDIGLQHTHPMKLKYIYLNPHNYMNEKLADDGHHLVYSAMPGQNCDVPTGYKILFELHMRICRYKEDITG
jgi:hypothetical protein